MEKANHSAAQRWWRTLPDQVTPAQAQARLDAWCARHGDARTRARDGARVTVGELAAAEPLAPLPRVPFPAVIEDTRAVSAQALVSWHGNFYSVPPGHGGQCRRKERRPPSAAALAEAAALRGGDAVTGAPVTDFATWAAAARPLHPDGHTAGQH